MKRTKYTIGEVTESTESQELVPDLMAELARQVKGKRGETAREHRELLRDVQKRMDADHSVDEVRDYFDTEEAGRDIEALIQALDMYSAPYFRFDVDDTNVQKDVYGYWLQWYVVRDDFDGLKVADLADVPANYRGEVLMVNDHGNMTLYVKTARKFVEVWAVVLRQERRA